MENKKQNSVLKAIVLAASWLTLSPLLLILDGRWRLLPKWLRIVLFVFSPLMLIAVAVLVLCGYNYYWEHYMEHHFVKRRVIENITGVRLPKYKVVDWRRTSPCFSRFYEDTYDFTLEFNKMPDEEFYKKLDECFDHFESGEYSYSVIWGNGLEAPKGELDNNDFSFSIDIKRDSKTFHIRAMQW